MKRSAASKKLWASQVSSTIKPRGPRRHTTCSLATQKGTSWHLHRDGHQSCKRPHGITTVSPIRTTALGGDKHAAFPIILVSVLHPLELHK